MSCTPPLPAGPASAPTSAPIQTTSVQRAVVTQSLASYSGTQQATSLGGYGGTAALGTGTFPNFVVNGGTVTDSGTFTGSFTYAYGALTAASFTLTDAASDGTATISSSGTPPVTSGIIKRTSTGAVLATFSADAAGNGTITYSNGTTGQIVNWQVVG